MVFLHQHLLLAIYGVVWKFSDFYSFVSALLCEALIVYPPLWHLLWKLLLPLHASVLHVCYTAATQCVLSILDRTYSPSIPSSPLMFAIQVRVEHGQSRDSRVSVCVWWWPPCYCRYCAQSVWEYIAATRTHTPCKHTHNQKHKYKIQNGSQTPLVLAY